MTQAELNRQIAMATGETVSAIADMGFVPLTRGPVERDPLVIDWDNLEQSREVVFPV